MAKSAAEKLALKEAKAAAKAAAAEKNEIALTEFTMKDPKGKKFVVNAPDDSIDDHAESALSGHYRHA